MKSHFLNCNLSLILTSLKGRPDFFLQAQLVDEELIPTRPSA